MGANPAVDTATNDGRREIVPLPAPFRLTAGGELATGHLLVESWGRLSPARDNAILLYTGLSASAHAASLPQDPTPGWWEDLIGPGKALDTSRYFIVCANSLGSCFGSSGPGDVDPVTGAPVGFAWPALQVEDIARGGQVAAEYYGIGRLKAVVGASLGGMVALAHTALFPGRARELVSISGALVPSAFAIATRALQRELLGSALISGAIDLPLAFRLARKVGMLSYIGAELLESRFANTLSDKTPGSSGTHFEVESWLEHQAQKFASRYNAWSYWYISRAMDLFDFTRHRRAGSATPYGLQLDRALVIGVREDQLFPLNQQAEIASMLRAEHVPTRFIELSSPYGHDSFLVEDAMFTPLLADFLAGEGAQLQTSAPA